MKKLLLIIVLWFLVSLPKVIGAKNNLISFVDVSFCNDKWDTEKDLNIKLIPGVEKKICVQIKNNSNIPIKLNLDIVEWSITNDAYKNKACKVEWWDFVKYISIPWWDDVINLEANTTIKKDVKIKFPYWIKWVQHWCLTYSIASAWNTNKNEMFDIVIRKANFMDIFIDNKVDIKNILELEDIQSKSLSKNKKIRTFFDQKNNLILEFNILNNSIIDESIIVTWNISDYFGYSKDFEIKAKTIYSNTEEPFQINLWKLPVYKWLFKTKFNLSYKPIFTFDTNNITEDILKWWVIAQNFSIILVSRNLLLRIVVILLFLKGLFRIGRRSRESNKSKS